MTCPPKTNPKDKLGLEQKGGRENAKKAVHIGTEYHQTSRKRSAIKPGDDRDRGGEKVGNQRNALAKHLCKAAGMIAQV